jgi:FixJ family two-component response regulator
MANIHLISVVDDDDSVRNSLQRLIRSAGLEVKVFASAKEFLNSDHLRDTRCLILDVQMPAMSGLELQRLLARAAIEIPVIFITAQEDESARSQALRDGAVDYLLKPFSEEALLSAIHAAVGREEVDRETIETAKKV